MTSIVLQSKLRRSPLYVVPNFSDYTPIPALGPSTPHLHDDFQPFFFFFTGLMGEHQRVNAALAIGMCRAFLKQNLYATGPAADARQWKSNQHSSREPIKLPQPFLDGLQNTKVTWIFLFLLLFLFLSIFVLFLVKLNHSSGLVVRRSWHSPPTPPLNSTSTARTPERVSHLLLRGSTRLRRLPLQNACCCSIANKTVTRMLCWRPSSVVGCDSHV